MYTQSQFMAEMLNELRTPTNLVLGFSKVLMDGKDGDLNHHQAEDVSAIQVGGKQVQRLLNLIHEIVTIDYSLKHPSPNDLAWEMIDVRDTVSDAFLQMEENSHFLYEDISFPLAILIEAPDELPLIKADKIAFVHIIQTFIMAAVGSVSPPTRNAIKIDYDSNFVYLSMIADPEGYFVKFDELPQKYPFTDIYASIGLEKETQEPNPVSLAICHGLSHLYGAELRTQITASGSILILRLARNS